MSPASFWDLPEPSRFERRFNLVTVILGAIVSPYLGSRYLAFDPRRLGTLDHPIDIEIG